jgi:tetratricopeptide (TPR) repeat protein
VSKKRDKKRRRKTQGFPKGWRASPKQVETWLDRLEQQLMDEKYKAAAQTARRVLRHVPESSKPAGEAYERLGVALTLLQDFDGAYEALSQALTVTPEDATIWFNRAGAARFTMRFGQSVRDLERALELETNSDLQKRIEEDLAFIRDIAEGEMALRGPDFTLDDLIEQQELFQTAGRLMENKQWGEAEEVLRRVIEMGDCNPQPWGNLAGCLIMQERYDAAEEALRRALEIDPSYDLAQQNLARLPAIRQSGPVDLLLRHPFEGKPLKQSITFFRE